MMMNKNLARWKEARYIFDVLTSSSKQGSFESALWRISDYHVTRDSFIQTIIGEFTINRKFKIDSHLGRLFDCFANKQNEVDFRLILCTYLCLLYSNFVLDNPRRIIFKLFDVFSASNDEKITFEDAANLLSIAVVSKKEYDVMRERLIKKLKELCLIPVHGPIPVYYQVSKTVLNSVLDIDPGMLLDFRDHLFQQIDKSKQLSMLARKEEISLKQFLCKSRKIKLSHIIFRWTYRLQLQCIKKWKDFKNNEVLRKKSSEWMVMWLTQLRLRQWKCKAKKNVSVYYKNQLAEEKGKHKRLERYFHQWMKYIIVTRRISFACKYTSREFKRMNHGFGLLRVLCQQANLRLYFATWSCITHMERKMEEARQFSEMKQIKRSFILFKETSKVNIKERRNEKKAADQQNWLLRQLNEIELYALRQKLEIEEEKNLGEQRKQHETLYSDNMVQQKKRAEQKTEDKYTRDVQEEKRRNRAATQKVALMSLLENEWTLKREKMEKENIMQMGLFLKNPASKEIISKALKSLKRDFFYPSSKEKENVEDTLVSLPHICASVIDGKLFKNGILVNDFVMNIYQKNGATPRLTFVEFLNLIKSFNIDVSNFLIRSLYMEVSSNDVNDIANDDRRLIEIDKLQLCFSQSFVHNGEQGSPWKRYISPAHQVLLYHNVVNDKKVMDYEMNNKIFREIVHENLRTASLLKMRKTFPGKKQEYFKLAMEDQAAKTIQKMYMRWKRKKTQFQKNWKQYIKAFKLQRKEQQLAGTKYLHTK